MCSIEEPFNSVLCDFHLLFELLLIVHGEYSQKTGELLVEGLEDQLGLCWDCEGLELGLCFNLKDMHQPLQHWIKLGLCLFIVNLLAQHRPEPGDLGHELDQPDIELVLKAEGQDENGPGVDGVLL